MEVGCGCEGDEIDADESLGRELGDEDGRRRDERERGIVKAAIYYLSVA